MEREVQRKACVRLEERKMDFQAPCIRGKWKAAVAKIEGEQAQDDSHRLVALLEEVMEDQMNEL
jgi:hypothetical protein